MANYSTVDAVNRILEQLQEGVKTEGKIVKIMAWNGTEYQYIEGYEGAKTLIWDADGNLIELQVTVVQEDGTEKNLKRTFTYDANGNLTSIGRWEVV